MPFDLPDTRFGDEHMGDGSGVMNGIIVAHIDCDPSFCPAGDMSVEIVETDTGVVLAAGAVECKGVPTRHELPMQEARPLQQTIAKARYTCGGEKKAEDQARIWIKNE